MIRARWKKKEKDTNNRKIKEGTQSEERRKQSDTGEAVELCSVTKWNRKKKKKKIIRISWVIITYSPSESPLLIFLFHFFALLFPILLLLFAFLPQKLFIFICLLFFFSTVYFFLNKFCCFFSSLGLFLSLPLSRFLSFKNKSTHTLIDLPFFSPPSHYRT